MAKIAMITGATSGIGLATAHRLALAGMHLILCGRRKEKLEDLEESFSAITRVQTLAFDVRLKEEVFSAIASLPEQWQQVDILINSAGNAHGMSSIDEGNIEDWDAMIDGNVQGLLYVSKAIMPKMVSRKAGHIVNIGSVAGKYTYPNGAVYCASKKAVEAISEGMRLDLTQHGIKVTNIAPGLVETAFSLVRFKGDENKANKVYDGIDALTATDVADMIVYAVLAPPHVTIADVLMYPSAQASPTMVYRKDHL